MASFVKALRWVFKGSRSEPLSIAEADFVGRFHTEGDSLAKSGIVLLEHAAKARFFEIEQYWKRAQYFWTLIAASFGGYFALSSIETPNHEAELLVCCLGFVFSSAWYAVNRGSSLWHRSWDLKVECLERRIFGPLYTLHLLDPEPKLISFGAFPFSGSRIQEIASIYVALIWLYLACKAGFTELGIYELRPWVTVRLIALMTLATMLSILLLGRRRDSLSSGEYRLLERTGQDDKRGKAEADS